MVHSCIQMFADDTKLCTEIQDDNNVTLLQSDLDSLQEWAKIWQVNLTRGNVKYYISDGQINMPATTKQ